MLKLRWQVLRGVSFGNEISFEKKYLAKRKKVI